VLNRNLLARAVAVLGLLFFALVVVADMSPAEARFSSCATDPLVYLSNGDWVQITARIQTDASNVRAVSYTLHAPPGVTVSRIVYTGGVFARKETFALSNDSDSDHYETDTVVTTHIPGVKVTTTTALRAYQVSSSVSGYDQQHLRVTVHRDSVRSGWSMPNRKCSWGVNCAAK
jgi:hypothetical protein